MEVVSATKADTQQLISEDMQVLINKAAAIIKQSNALLLTSGAGLGVDSGLPDFRGSEGFWKAYPPMKKLGLEFSQMSTPSWFTTDPALAWGFWSHRYNLYSSKEPHEGYYLMKKWALEKQLYYVFTSNVDGHWLKAGIPEDHVYECHGSVHYMQCLNNCSPSKDLIIWPSAEQFKSLSFNEETFHANKPFPICKNCKTQSARPNVLMFGDYGWASDRNDRQEIEFEEYQRKLNQNKNSLKLAIIEVGAGTGVPTVRNLSESFMRVHGASLIRINLRDSENHHEGNHVSLPMGGKAALTQIDIALQKL